ncbi:MAG: hypothetical protein KF819_18165 [Labilithrix sp.]|nr:hypothetical protein [Labilithrix sp.]
MHTLEDIRDRAFAASTLAMRGDADPSLYARIRQAAEAEHAGVRARIRDGTLDKEAFLAELRRAPLEIRDHLVEEILDVAYPPFGDRGHTPSGLAEILFTLDNAGLGPGKTFVDLGAGLGKVAMLVALLSGARAIGVELDAHLVAHARAASRALGLDGVELVEGDLRDVALPPADVYYMYIPFAGSAAVVERLAPIAAERDIVLFSQPLDGARFPWLEARGTASYWLEIYESRLTGDRLVTY